MLVKVSPFASLLNRNSLFDDLFGGPVPATRATFEPNVDVTESENEYQIRAELPGLSRDDFKVTVENEVLILEGEKKSENEESKNGYFRTERSYGAFKRSFRLTDSISKSKIKANYADGILTIVLPKGETAKPKQIEVSTK